MNVGLLFPFRNPPQWRTPWPEFYAEQFRQIQMAEQLGYDTAWLTEHHFSEDGYSPSLIPIAATAAAQTSTIRIGTFLILLPFHHPDDMAECHAELRKHLDRKTPFYRTSTACDAAMVRGNGSSIAAESFRATRRDSRCA